jgi:hypothetical protein
MRLVRSTVTVGGCRSVLTLDRFARAMNDYDYRTAGERQIESVSGSQRMPVWKEVLLWVAVLPGAFVGSTVAYWLMHGVMWLGSSRFGDDSWFYYIWKEVFTNGICGAAWVYCASFIAPRGKIAVSITFASLVLFISGISFFTSIARHEWMTLLGVIFLNVGAIVTAVSITTGETKL